MRMQAADVTSVSAVGNFAGLTTLLGAKHACDNKGGDLASRLGLTPISKRGALQTIKHEMARLGWPSTRSTTPEAKPLSPSGRKFKRDEAIVMELHDGSLISASQGEDGSPIFCTASCEAPLLLTRDNLTTATGQQYTPLAEGGGARAVGSFEAGQKAKRHCIA